MLDAKKVRLSLALLPGREVLLVGVIRETLGSGIYRYPKVIQRIFSLIQTEYGGHMRI